MPQLSDYKAPYPEPDSEYQRHVIYLDPKDESVEQQHLKIELLPGKTMYVDDESKYVIQGQIDEKTVQGWGYDYYVVQFGQVINKKTQDPVQPTGPERAFIPIESAGPTLRYNSKLPIVVYVPHGAEVRYRIWYDEVARLKEQGSSLVRDGSMVKDSNAGTLNPTQVATGYSNLQQPAATRGRTLDAGEYTNPPRDEVYNPGTAAAYASNAYSSNGTRAVPLSGGESGSGTSPSRNRSGSSPSKNKRNSKEDTSAAVRTRDVPMPLSTTEVSATRDRGSLAATETSATRTRAVPLSGGETGAGTSPSRNRSGSSPSKNKRNSKEDTSAVRTRDVPMPLSTTEVSATRDRSDSKTKSPSKSPRRGSSPRKETKEEAAARKARYDHEL